MIKARRRVGVILSAVVLPTAALFAFGASRAQTTAPNTTAAAPAKPAGAPTTLDPAADRRRALAKQRRAREAVQQAREQTLLAAHASAVAVRPAPRRHHRPDSVHVGLTPAGRRAASPPPLPASGAAAVGP